MLTKFETKSARVKGKHSESWLILWLALFVTYLGSLFCGSVSYELCLQVCSFFNACISSRRIFKYFNSFAMCIDTFFLVVTTNSLRFFNPWSKLFRFKMYPLFHQNFKYLIVLDHLQALPFTLLDLGFLQVSTMVLFSYGIIACVHFWRDLTSMMVSLSPDHYQSVGHYFTSL